MIDVYADNVVSRQREIAQYQMNIDAYQAVMLQLPPGDVPDEIRQYMGTPADRLPHSLGLDLIMHVADYQHRDQLKQRIISEMIQQNVARWSMRGVMELIPEDQRDTALAAATNRASV